MPIKVNKPGLNLRKKSNIHASIIDEKTGRRKTDVSDSVRHAISNAPLKGELWGNNGHMVDYKFQALLKKRLLKKFNLSQLKDKNILVLGPGKGAEVVFIKSLLKEINVDVLGLSKNLSAEAKNLVRKDFSPENPSFKKVFEHLNHSSLVRKYDFIYSSLGPTTHTNYPELVILKIATLLKPEGVAVIPYIIDYNINYNKLIKQYGLDNFKIKFDKDLNLYIKRIK